MKKLIKWGGFLILLLVVVEGVKLASSSEGNISLSGLQKRFEEFFEREHPESDGDNPFFEKDYPVMYGDIEKTQIICPPEEEIRRLSISFSGTVLKIVCSEDDKVSMEAKNAGKLQAFQKDGELVIKGLRSSDMQNVFDSSEVILYLPKDKRYFGNIELGAGQLKCEDISFEELKLSVEAGQFISQNMEVMNLEVMVGAGSAGFTQAQVNKMIAQLGAGNLSFQGEVKDSAELNCAFGNMDIKLAGEEKDYNYTVSALAGNVSLDKKKIASGAMEEKSVDNGSDKDIIIQCNMGNISLSFQ